MQQSPRDEDDSGPGDPQDDVRRKTAMRARGWTKVVLVTVALNQVLTFVFAYLAQLIDPGLTVIETLVFSCTTCAFVSYWLLVDARNAWRNALENGRIGSGCGENGDDFPRIADNCAKGWLVVLHIELNPDLAGTG